MNIRLYKLLGLSVYTHPKSHPKPRPRPLPQPPPKSSYSPQIHLPSIKDYPIDIPKKKS